MANNTITWSDFQNNMFNEFVNTRNSFVVNAVAGSGKTASSLEMMRRYCTQVNTSRYSCVFLAFNKSIAAENKTKVEAMGLAQNIEVSTVHALGFRAIRKGLGNRPIALDDKKYRQFLESAIYSLSSMVTIDMDKQFISSAISNANNLYRIARLNLVQPNEIGTLRGLCERHNIECVADEVNIVANMLRTAYQYDGKSIDFTDMLTLSVTQFKAYVPKYLNVVIDEAQDLSKAQQALMLCAIMPKYGRFVAVGDPWQAINGFAGAMNDSFSQLVELAHGRELPLSVNYRCGSEIIKLAQSVYPTIQAHEGACEGEVKRVTDFKELESTDYIICRKSSPLLTLALKLIANGRSAYVEGKDILEGLKNLIKKLNARDISSLYLKLDKEVEKKMNEARKKGEQDPENCASVQAMRDKVECIKVIGDTCMTINQINDKLDTIFDDRKKGNAIKLSTAHKSKGLESNRVWIIVPQKLPLCFKGQQEWEYEQELHLQYVAYTRAKKTLYICGLDEDGVTRYQF